MVESTPLLKERSSDATEGSNPSRSAINRLRAGSEVFTADDAMGDAREVARKISLLGDHPAARQIH